MPTADIPQAAPIVRHEVTTVTSPSDPDFIPPVVSKPSKYRYLWLVFIAILVVSVVGGGAYLIDAESKKAPSQIGGLLTPTPVLTRTPGISPTPIPLSEWKTYANAGKEISFKYPGNLTSAKESLAIEGEVLFCLEDLAKKPTMGTDMPYDAFCLMESENRKQLGLKPFVDTVITDFYRQQQIPINEGIEQLKIRDMTVGGRPAMRFDLNPFTTDRTYVQSPNGERTFLFLRSPSKGSFESVYDTILSTVSFSVASPTATVTTAVGSASAGKQTSR